MPLQAQQGGEARGAPAQGDAGAAMAVIVDQPLVAERLAPDDETGGAIGPQARDSADHALRRGEHGRQAAGALPAPAGHGRAARQSEARSGPWLRRRESPGDLSESRLAAKRPAEKVSYSHGPPSFA